MIRARTLPLLAALLAALAAADLAARWADEAAIRQTVQYYFDGGRDGDSVTLRKAFHPDARMLFVREGRLVVVPIGEYITRVGQGKPTPGSADSVKRRVAAVDLFGDAAVAKLEIERPDGLITDYMSLLKTDGRWLIVSKIFSRAARPAQAAR